MDFPLASSADLKESVLKLILKILKSQKEILALILERQKRAQLGGNKWKTSPQRKYKMDSVIIDDYIFDFRHSGSKLQKINVFISSRLFNLHTVLII